MSPGPSEGHGPPFTPDQAHALAPELIRLADAAVGVRADLTAAARVATPALADVKGHEAHLADLLDQIRDLGVQLKGWAPLLVDLEVAVDGRVVLFCWLEGNREFGWYHEVEHGFAGRRPLGQLAG